MPSPELVVEIKPMHELRAIAETPTKVDQSLLGFQRTHALSPLERGVRSFPQRRNLKSRPLRWSEMHDANPQLRF